VTFTATISGTVMIDYSDPVGVTIRSRGGFAPPTLRTPEEVDLALDILRKAQEEMIRRRLGAEQRTGEAFACYQGWLVGEMLEKLK
jgi:hypothetical protein